MSEQPAPSNARIVLSYRREDVPHAVDRIADQLRERFGSQAVFVDIASIEPGKNWREVLAHALESCDAMLVLIGPRWAATNSSRGLGALHEARDVVRTEIATALTREIFVIPVLLDGAKTPQPEELPADLKGLADCQAISVRRERFESDVEIVIQRIDAEVGLLASLGRRAIAFAFDLAAPVGVILYMNEPYRVEAVGFFATFALYHWILVAAMGCTLGKLLMGIRVEFSGRSLRWVDALCRPTLGYAFSIFSVIGLVQFALHTRHSTFHDRIFETRVLRSRRRAKWKAPQRLDDLSYAVDDRVQRLLGRMGPLGRLVSYLVSGYFGVDFFVRGTTALVIWLLAKLGFAAGESGANTATAAVVEAAAGETTAASVGSASYGAGSSTFSLAVSGSHVISGLGLTLACVVAYESTVPDPMKILSRPSRSAIVTRVEYPRTVLFDGPEEDLKIWWAGRLEFPVTVTLAPKAGERQPVGAGPREGTFSDVANPLLLEDVICALEYPQNVEFRFEVRLKDAAGLETESVDVFFRAIRDKDAPPRSGRTGPGAGWYRGLCQH